MAYLLIHYAFVVNINNKVGAWNISPLSAPVTDGISDTQHHSASTASIRSNSPSASATRHLTERETLSLEKNNVEQDGGSLEYVF